MAFKKKVEATADYAISAPQVGLIRFNVLGISPMIYNAVSQKAKLELLFPRGRMTTAQKATNLKHNPLEEYRNSVYRFREDDQPTRLFFPGGGFKKALQNSAKRVEGTSGAEIAQLTWVQEHDVPIFGTPQLYMAGVRSAGMDRTPDIRTRAILPVWAASFSVQYVKPVNDVSMVNLVIAAGLLCGIGDGRQEKGYGHGQFKIVSADNKADMKAFERLVAEGGRAAQDAALAEPTMYDLETEVLLGKYNERLAERGDRHTKTNFADGDGADIANDDDAGTTGRKRGRRQPTDGVPAEAA